MEVHMHRNARNVAIGLVPGPASATTPWSTGCTVVANQNYLCNFSDANLQGVWGHWFGSDSNYDGQVYNAGTSISVNNTTSSVANLYSNKDVTWHHDPKGGNGFCINPNIAATYVGSADDNRFSSHQLAANTTLAEEAYNNQRRLMEPLQASNKAPRARGALVTVGLLAVLAILYVSRYASPNGSWPADEALAGQVRDIIAKTLSHQACTTPADAVPAMHAALNEGGYTDWAVRSGNAVKPAACVTANVDGEKHEVVLIPALRPEVRKEMDKLTLDLYVRCLDQATAIETVTSVLHEVGETHFEIRTDGPVTAPIDRLEEVLAHVKAGCWIYAGTGWTPDGMRLYYARGRERSNNEPGGRWCPLRG
jgi:hypothetical protein